MDEQVVYWIGFFVALAFIVFGADDVLWDVFALFRGTGKKRVKLSLINEKPPKMLAVVIAAWHEDAVLGEVVDNLVAPRSTRARCTGCFWASIPTMRLPWPWLARSRRAMEAPWCAWWETIPDPRRRPPTSTIPCGPSGNTRPSATCASRASPSMTRRTWCTPTSSR